MKTDLVLAGCGVLSAAYSGALRALHQHLHLEPQNIAGTSAGAIVASLIACGYQFHELDRVLFTTDFQAFRDGRLFRHSWDFNVHGGLYRGEALERWLDKLLSGRTMGQTIVPLSVVCFDIRNYETVVISSASHPEMPVARAVRMSASIPLFFRSVAWQDEEVMREIVDGGVLENFPVEIFDVAGEPRWPTIGLYLDDVSAPSDLPCLPKGPETALKLFGAIRAAYARKMNGHNQYRSVCIPDIGVSSIDFGLSTTDKRRLRNIGALAGTEFAGRWLLGGEFEGYKKRYRSVVAAAQFGNTEVTAT